MKFYDCETAPSPRRVRIFIAEKGIDIETVQIDLASGEQFSDEYRAINPDCVVPALVLDDGSCITEAGAICHYLEECYPEPSLLGATPEQRAATIMWNTKAEQQGLLACAEAFRNAARGLKDRAIPGPENYAQIPELAERGRQRAAAFLTKLDKQLARHEFVAGGHYSMADITAMIVVDFATRLKIPVPEDAAHLRRWYDTVSARSSAAA